MVQNMLKFSKIIFFLLLTISLFPKNPVKIKNLVNIEGLRENQIMGFGLVAGLDGRGDSKSFNLTKKMFSNLISNHGYSITENDLKSKNIAAVMVTANLGAFSRAGDYLDVTVSSIGDSKSIEGGVLLQTALKGSDGLTYAAAQGKVIAGNKKENSIAVASIPAGAIIEKELISDFIVNNKIRIVLKYPDFVTATQIASEIQKISNTLSVKALDAALVEITLTENELKNPIEFIAKFSALTVTPDFTSAVVVDKKSGIIVIGEDIVIQNCVVSTPFAQINVGGGQKSKNFEIKSQTTGELVKLLNDVGLNNNEIISILESLHKMGAINAKILIL